LDLLLFLIAAIAIFTAAVAKSKGRDFFGWLILGGLFPIIALIAVGFMPSLDGKMQRHNSKQCPRCAHRVPLVAAVCSYCGNGFDLQAEGAAARSLDIRRLALLVAGVIALIAVAALAGR
jgi:hypothetical protein